MKRGIFDFQEDVHQKDFTDKLTFLKAKKERHRGSRGVSPYLKFSPSNIFILHEDSCKGDGYELREAGYCYFFEGKG